MPLDSRLLTCHHVILLLIIILEIPSHQLPAIAVTQTADFPTFTRHPLFDFITLADSYIARLRYEMQRGLLPTRYFRDDHPVLVPRKAGLVWCPKWRCSFTMNDSNVEDGVLLQQSFPLHYSNNS